jgi:cytochrome P450
MLVVPPIDNTLVPLLAALVLLLAGVTHCLCFARPKLIGLDKNGNVIPLRKIHRPKSTLPVLGNLLDVIKNKRRILEWAVDLSLEFDNEPWARRFPGQPDMILFSTPEPIEEITTTQFENFKKGEFQVDVLAGLFGYGLVASDGERWFNQRKTAAKFFSARSLRALMTKSMRKNAEQVCDVIASSQRVGEMVDLKKLFHEFTLQTFVEMGLGSDLQWIGASDPHPFQHAIDRVSPIITKRFRQPAWMWKFQRWLNVGSEAVLAKHMTTVFKWLHEVTQDSLTKAVEEKTNLPGEESVKSVVELFVESSRDDAAGVRSEDLVDFLLTFIVAARDTTATTLSWFFYELSKNPQVEKTIRGEMASRLPDCVQNDKTVYLTTEHTRNLTYLEATIKEVLRLRPAAPTLPRQVVRDTVVCGDIPLYEGQIVLLCPFTMARNPRVWGPDAAEFKPERWINKTTGELLQFPSSKFFSFGAGPRTCIGMNLAMLELRIVLANLIHRFRFDVDPSNDGSYVPAPTHVMKHPLNVHVHSA